MANKERIEKISDQIKKLNRELIDNRSIADDLEKRRREIQRDLQNLQNTLQSFRPQNLVVSDHVILRYAERHYKIDFDAIKKEIEEKMKGAETVGDLKYAGFIVKGNVVVTYVGDIERGR